MANTTAYYTTALLTNGTITLPLSSEYNFYNLTGSVTLSGNLTIAADGTPPQGVAFYVLLGEVITGANTFTVFGSSVGARDIKPNTLVVAVYDGANYTVTLIPSFLESDIIAASNIPNTIITLDKLVNIAAGNIIVGNGSNRPTSVAMSGDITISNSGATTIANAAVTSGKIATDAVRTASILNGTVTLAKLEASLQAFFANSALEFYEEIVIPSASVLTLFTTPVTIVAAQGAGASIIVKRATMSVDFNSIAYTTNGIVELACDGAGAAQAISGANNGLFASVSRESNIAVNSAATVGQSVIIPNTALVVRVATADPAAGNSDITVRVWYSIQQ